MGLFKKVWLPLVLTLAIVAGARRRQAGAAWNTVLTARASRLAKTCGLISQIFSPAAPASLREYMHTACVGECSDARSLVDVGIVSGTRWEPLLAAGEICEGTTFSVLNPHTGPIANPPKAVLQVVLEPRGPNRFDFGVRVASYSESEGASGIMPCGEYSGSAAYRGDAWHLK